MKEMDRTDYWLVRLTTALSRAKQLGTDDWRLDIPTLLADFHDEWGQFGQCEVCSELGWVKLTSVGGSNPDNLRVCRACRHEAGYDERLP